MTPTQFELLTEVNYDYLLRYAKSLVVHQEDGVDLLQRTLEYQLTHLDSNKDDRNLDKSKAFRSYVCKKILFFSKDPVFTWSQYNEVPEECLGWDSEPQNSMRTDIEVAVLKLPEKYRRAAILYLKGYTVREIGVKLGCSHMTVDRYWLKAQSLLQTTLSAYHPKPRRESL